MGRTKMRGNGTGSVYRLPNGKWRAVVTIGYTAKGKRITRSRSNFRTKKAALAALPGLKYTVEYSDITFAKAWETIKPALYTDISPGKSSEYDRAWLRLGTLHMQRIVGVRASDLQIAIDTVPCGYHPKKAAKNVLGHIYKFATANDIVAKNYTAFVELPPCPKPVKDAFTADEINNIWAVANGGNAAAQYALVMIYCGMRPGELRTQLIENINLHEQYMTGGIKTSAGKNRIIRLPTD